MADYIERVALKRELAPYEENDFSQQMDVILAIVDAQPAADVAEVRHGRWIRQPSEILGLDIEFCSECGQGMNERNQFWNAKYCPNCGVRMGKEDEHEAN